MYTQHFHHGMHVRAKYDRLYRGKAWIKQGDIGVVIKPEPQEPVGLRLGDYGVVVRFYSHPHHDFLMLASKLEPVETPDGTSQETPTAD